MFIHGANLLQKEKSEKKYNTPEHKQMLTEIREKYDVWHQKNMGLIGPLRKLKDQDRDLVEERVSLLNEYKDFIDKQKYAEAFDSRSNLHSSVLEEFMYYLFKDLVADFSDSALIGKSDTFKDIFFLPENFEEMISEPKVLIEKKDHDFAIGAKIFVKMRCEGQDRFHEDYWDIPAVAIECKTYLDKTMLQDASTAASQLKAKNPNALYIVVAEWLKLTNAVNLRKYKIDQIYIFRKQKNTDREYRYLPTYQKNPIYDDVIWHLFSTVRDFLSIPWEGGISYGLERGFLIN